MKALLKRIVAGILLLALLVVSGCSLQTPEIKDYVIVQDQLGREVKVPAEVKSIVSTWYIGTSLLLSLGAGDRLVAVEQQADKRPLYPQVAPELVKLPEIGTAKTMNLEEVVKLKPDLVVVPTRMEDYVKQLEQQNITVIAVEPEDLESLPAAITIVGNAIGETERAQKLVDYYWDKVDHAQSVAAQSKDQPKVYMGGSDSVLRTCSNQMFQHTMMELAGGKNVAAELNQGYWTDISYEQLIAWNPEVIFTVRDANYTKADLVEDPKWQVLTAVKSGQIYTFPSALEPWDYPIPATVLGLMWMTHLLHPEAYDQAEFHNDVVYFYQEFYGIKTTPTELGL